MADETCGVTIKGFVGLKSKMYTFKAKDDHECKRSDDIGKYIVDGELKYKGNKNVLFDRSYIRHEMNRIQSKYQNIGT